MTNKSMFARRLADIRRTIGITQEDLADRLGVTRTSVTYWETGRNFPRRKMLVAIANALNVDADWLAGYGSGETYDQLTVALKTRGFERIEDVFAELDQLKRERDATIRQMMEADKANPFACVFCKHDELCDGRVLVCGDCEMDCPCNTCIDHSNWKWRGVEVEE